MAPTRESSKLRPISSPIHSDHVINAPGTTTMWTMRALMKPRLYASYKQFTHGGLFWRDQYLLERWDKCTQRVVYRDDIFHGYKILRRLGNWSWLTRDPHTDEFLTVKFLPRGDIAELDMWRYLRTNCSSPYVVSMRDHFQVGHHLGHQPSFKHVVFDAVVYPTTGSSLERALSVFEQCQSPNLPLSLETRQNCIRQIVCGMAELHRIGVVHGDLHPGNVAFAQPGTAHINNFLIEPPLEHQVLRKDELPTPAHLPQRVCEPQDLGFGPGVVKILDFGYSFRPVNGAVYPATVFPSGTPRPPELLSGQKVATLPFKADSWYLGQLIYFILTHGWCLFPSSIGSNSEDVLEEYKDRLTKLYNGRDNLINQLPSSVKEHFTPYILALLDIQPQMRLSIADLRGDKLFMETTITL